MTWVLRAAALAFVMFATVPAGPLARADVVNVVQVRNFRYEPQTLSLAKGETVRFTAMDTKHTVTARDGRFDFFPDRTLNQGESVEWTFRADETVAYYCRIHEPSMAGVIVVGEGSPRPPPPLEPAPEVREVPAGYPTITAALAAAPRGTVIRIAPGRYAEKVALNRPEVRIEGTGAAPSDVVLDAGGAEAGITVTAAGASVANLRITNALTGVAVPGATDFIVSRVEADDMRAAVVASGVEGGTIEDIVARRAQLAGVVVEACTRCDVVVQRIDVRNSRAGFLARNASALVLRGSTFVGNGVGVVLRSEPSHGIPQRGAHVVGNTFTANLGTAIPAASSPTESLAVGAGVWIDGGWHNVVQGNVVMRQRYGIAVTGLGGPVDGNRIIDNRIRESLQADLGWDGVGVRTCFAGNTGSTGEPFSEPRLVQTLYPCSALATVGIPWPKVDVDLLAYAAGR